MVHINTSILETTYNSQFQESFIHPGHPLMMPLAETNHLLINKYSLDDLVFILTWYYDIHDKTFHKLALWERKVETTYLFYLWGVLVLMKVWSRSHHLKHQWPQISIFIFNNHPTRHHAYFKHTQVHIQVFHMLQSHNEIILTTGPIQMCKSPTKIC